MNTLSSLLKWIGNTIGANPNTLVTTDKTIVGAINEAVGANPNTLTTTDKTIVGAINEVHGKFTGDFVLVTKTSETISANRLSNVTFASADLEAAGITNVDDYMLISTQVDYNEGASNGVQLLSPAYWGGFSTGLDPVPDSGAAKFGVPRVQSNVGSNSVTVYLFNSYPNTAQKMIVKLLFMKVN